MTVLEFSTIFLICYQNSDNNKIPFTQKKYKNLCGIMYIIVFYIMRFPIISYYIYEYLLSNHRNNILIPGIIFIYVLNLYWGFKIYKKLNLWTMIF